MFGCFFAVVGLPEALTGGEGAVQLAAEASTAFFEARPELKQDVVAGANAYGYFPMQSEALGYGADVGKAPDLREAFSVGPSYPPPQRLKMNSRLSDVVSFCYQPTPWPATGSVTDGVTEVVTGDATGAGEKSSKQRPSPPPFQSSLQQFYDQSSALGSVLLRLVALALELPESHFENASAPGEHSNSARCIWYPKLSKPAAPRQARCGEHSDTGALTLLWADGPGLEVQPRCAGGGAGGAGQGKWVPVQAPAGAALVNIGDLLERMTKGRWRSTPHRVPAPDLADARLNRDRLVSHWHNIHCSVCGPLGPVAG